MTASPSRITRQTDSPEATLRLGQALGRSLVGGAVIALVGPLGAGKTQLVKGIAAGNAVDDVRRVTSPTFTLIHEYAGRLCLYHIDVYRLADPKELAALGFDELLHPDAVVVIEWADRVQSLIPGDALWVELAVTGDASRSFSFHAAGETATRCLDGLRTTCR